MKFREFINEGGNARGTNKKTGKETLAQKIPIKEIGRSEFIKKFTELFLNINKRFKAKYKFQLWKDTSILKNGLAFNGSTSFIMNPEISDDEIIPFKPTSGDIDIMVPSDSKEQLWHLLDDLEGKEVMTGVTYMGCNKPTVSSIGDQINSVFQVKFGDIITQSQVDFELTMFVNDKPDEFSRFSHSSSLTDTQKGFKGVSHKYILRALAGGSSQRDDVVIVTNKSTPEKFKIQQKNGSPVVPNFLKFSVGRGLRYAYEQQFLPDGSPWMIKSKEVYKEIPSKSSTYETDLIKIFEIMFGSKDSKELQKMWSFTGVVHLMKEHFSKKQNQATLDRLVQICWGKGAQALERDKADIDLEIKSNTVNYVIKKLGLSDAGIDKQIKEYYKNYKKAKVFESLKFKDYIR